MDVHPLKMVLIGIDPYPNDKKKTRYGPMAILPPQSVPRWKSWVTPHGATGPPRRLRDARPQNGQFFGCQKPSKTHGKTVEKTVSWDMGGLKLW